MDVGNHLGTVEGLTIRTVRLRDLDGVVHTIPFSQIKTIKNYSREFGYAMFRWPVPATMLIDDAVALVREVAAELRGDPTIYPFIWSPMELQGVESFDNGRRAALPLQDRAAAAMGSAARLQSAAAPPAGPAGLEPSMPRLNVQLSRMRQSRNPERDEASDKPA